MNDKNPIKIKNFTLDYNSNNSKININDKGNINNNNNWNNKKTKLRKYWESL